MSLFAEHARAATARVEPLPARMRPRNLDEFVGQEHVLGPGRLLRRLIEADRLSSAVFYGPPGCGKTALAGVIAARTQAAYESLHAAAAGVKDVREVSERARGRIENGGRRTVLFLDEIHRFNRGQQDALLRDVEAGVLILIGATTENPYFSVNGPLISRSTIFEFHPLNAVQIRALCIRALRDPQRGLGDSGVEVDDDALDFIADNAEGDARRALAALELAVIGRPAVEPSADGSAAPPRVTLADAADSMQRKVLRYDRDGDVHYDVISAFIKSMRGSDPDATVYWLARMLESGEDPMFIARRIAICASEDVGNAEPRALLVASAAAQVTHLIGLPEAELTLAHAAIYVACCPKSNAVMAAIAAARDDVRNAPTVPVPMHLRDASYRGATSLGRGDGYVYPHDFPGGVVAQDYLGVEKAYYNPTDRGEERRIGAGLAEFRRMRQSEPRP